MNEKHFTLKNKFTNFLAKIAFSDKKITTFGIGLNFFSYHLILSFKEKKKTFCDKMNLNARVIVNEHTLGPLSRSAKANFRGTHTSML